MLRLTLFRSVDVRSKLRSLRLAGTLTGCSHVQLPPSAIFSFGRPQGGRRSRRTVRNIRLGRNRNMSLMSISAEQFPCETIMREAARIFLCGDVMTGRGIDQILSHPCDPLLHENYVKSTRDYIRLAEQVNGRSPRAVKFSYLGRGSARVDPRSARCTHHQSRNQHHPQGRICTERHQLLNESRECRLLPVCRYRLLCAHQQPHFDWPCWAFRHAGKSGVFADRVGRSRA